ncbi:MAG TPA: shikimate dehydrogenase [Methylomirabilota bacterium]|jgi:shikimate dehydrogenase|nr:shikimate dehydrogenase [Methylomirabilota bacterium]
MSTLIPVTGQTHLVGIFGDPIAHTRSPAMQNAAFRARKLPYAYVPFLVHPADLAKAVQAIRAYNLVGVNVTVPHKERIVRYLDTLSAEAELCGAVNTVVNREGTLFGDNTDGRGFLVSLQERGFSPHGRKIVLIGAGGSTRAVLVSLIRAGSAHITIANRTLTKAQALVRAYRELGKTHLDAVPLSALEDPTLFKETALVVNCTSIGLHGEPFPPTAFSTTPRQCLFYDLLYRPHLTSFLRQARTARRPIRDGRRLLLHQGALAFTLWTGQPAPLEAMTRALNRALRGA